MDWSQLGTLGGVAAGVGGAAWQLGKAWTKKAIAIGEKAEAERAKEKEVAELRRSHEKFMERMEKSEGRILAVEVRMDERERHRRDTQGIPVRSDGE